MDLKIFSTRLSDIVNSEWDQRQTTKFNKLLRKVPHQMRTVTYIRANYLLQEYEKARSTGNYYDYMSKISGHDLLIIDDFGLMELDIDKCRDLFEIIETRDYRKSTMIVS